MSNALVVVEEFEIEIIDAAKNDLPVIDLDNSQFSVVEPHPDTYRLLAA